jgi:hypothetical protein
MQPVTQLWRRLEIFLTGAMALGVSLVPQSSR